MKKIFGLLSGLVLLSACSATTPQNTATTTSTKASTQLATQTTTQQTTTTVTTTTQKKVSKTIDYDAIQRGDFSSVAGTWRNKAGNELVFTQKGLANEDSQISGFAMQEDILYAQVHSVKEKTGYALNFVKKGMKISDKLFYNGSDNSDINRDRLFGAQAQLNADTFDPFYRVDE